MFKVLESFLGEGYIEDHEIQFKNGDYSFVIVPIDELVTFNFGLKQFACGILVKKKSHETMAGIYVPCENEIFFAEDLKTAKRNNISIGLNAINVLERSVVSIVTSFNSSPKNYFELELIPLLLQATLKTNVSSALLYEATRLVNGNLCALIVIDADPSQRDLVKNFVEMSGGTVSDEFGSELSEQSKIMIASNGHIHMQLIEILSRVNIHTFQ